MKLVNDGPLIDLGQASRRTQGVPYLVLFENGIPPNNKLFIF